MIARLATRAAVVIVRIDGLLELLRRVPGEQAQGDLDGLLKLRVVALADELRVVLDFNVRSDAVVLDLPLALQPVDGDARRGDMPAVHQFGIVVDADESAPGLLADERA